MSPMTSDADAVRLLLRPPEEARRSDDGPTEIAYRSGRTLRLEQGRIDLLEVTSPTGQVELRVRFTEDGPVLQFEGASIDLSNASRINLRSDEIRMYARDSIELESAGHVVVKGRGDVRVDGDPVLLNCTDQPIRR